MAHKHKEMSKPLAVLLFIVSLPFVLLGLLIFGLIYLLTTVLPAPIEAIIYKKSQFYKDFGIKYFLGVLSNFGYKTYKYVKENKSLSLVFQKEGYYYYKTENAVLVIPYYDGFFLENREWMADTGTSQGSIKVTDLKSVFAPLIEEDITNLELKLLVTEKLFMKNQLEEAKSRSEFVFYKDHKSFKDLMSCKEATEQKQ